LKKEIAFSKKKRTDFGLTFSSEKVKEIADQLGVLAFLNSAIQPGDKWAIISNNCPEWNFVDLAITAKLGRYQFPMYPNYALSFLIK